jgi:LEA14-like dessication related protein
MKTLAKSLGLLLCLAGCATAPAVAPEVAAPTLPGQELQVVSQSLTECTVKFDGVVQADAQAVKLEKARWEFVVDGAVVKSGELALGASVNPGEKAEFSLAQTVTYVKSAEELRAMDTRGGSLLLAVRGAVVATVTQPAVGEAPATTKTVELEFARSKEVKTPRLPHVKVVDFEAGRFSESEVQAVFHVGVVNPNNFTLTMTGLKFALSLGDKQVSEGTLGAGDRVAPASTGVFDVTGTMNEETHGKDVKKLIKGLNVPYVLTGTLSTPLYDEALESKGDIKLTASKDK